MLRAGIVFVAGCALVAVGAYQSFVTMGSISSVAVWGGIAIAGVFVAMYGLVGLLTGRRSTEKTERGGAPPKT